MRKTVKIVSLICVFVLLFCVIGTAATYPASVSPSCPTVYITGQGQYLTVVAGRQDVEQIYPPVVSDDYVTEQVKALIPVLSKCIVTDDWQPYIDGLYSAIAPLFEKSKCNFDGEITNGSGTRFQNVGNSVNPHCYKRAIPDTGVTGYDFVYDWRLSPYEVAVQLHDFIEQVEKKEGKDQVNIVARCLGANITLAYIDMYGAKDINKLILYSAGFDGMELFGALFSGKMDLDADSIETFCNGYLQSEEYAGDTVVTLLRALISTSNKLSSLGTATYWMNRCYDEIYERLLPKLLMDTVGNMPAFWSYVGSEYYADAKAFLFPTPELQARYAKLIEKIDRYYNNVTLHAEDLLTKAQNDGTDLFIIAKYGYALVPLRKDFSELQSDTFISLHNTSLGAVTTTLFDTFDDVYLRAAALHGLDIFIAPDNQVDASTCFIPERTWFLKNITHRTMPTCVNPLIQFILMEDEVTVFTDKDFPQYMVLNDEMTQMSPMVKENADTQEKSQMTFWQAIRQLFVTLKQLLKSYFAR